jgi:hypothetical protein
MSGAPILDEWSSLDNVDTESSWPSQSRENASVRRRACCAGDGVRMLQAAEHVDEDADSIIADGITALLHLAAAVGQDPDHEVARALRYFHRESA